MYTKEEVDRIFMLGRAIKHPLRQSILSLILQSKRIHVTDIYIKLRKEQSVISQHLRILHASNLVTTEREGKFIYYSINQETIRLIDQIITEIQELETV